MTESAEAVAADVDSRRSLTLEIKNYTQSYCLLNPRLHMENGQTYNPPQPTVRPLKTEVCVFTMKGGATGCVGVLTYDLFEKSRNDHVEKVAIMFSVPWDYNLYKNWFAVGIKPKGVECNQDLYKQLYYEKNQEQNQFARAEATGAGISYPGRFLDVRATMCPLGKAIMNVEVWDNRFTPAGQQSY